MFGNSVETPKTTLQLFEPDARAVYTLEQAARLTQLPRRLIAVYFKDGLVSPVMDPACSGWYFNDEAIRILRRIDICGRLWSQSGRHQTHAGTVKGGGTTTRRAKLCPTPLVSCPRNSKRYSPQEPRKHSPALVCG